MLSAGAVLVCVLTTLGRAEQSFPPIQFVERPAAGTPPLTEAFVVTGRDTIYLVTSATAFRAAQASDCQNDAAVKKVASILIHEEWHVLHGTDEQGAYLAQLRTLVMLDFGPQTTVYQGVRRAMVAAHLAAKPGRRAGWLASAGQRDTPSGVRAMRIDR